MLTTTTEIGDQLCPLCGYLVCDATAFEGDSLVSAIQSVAADFSDVPVCGTACELCVGHFCPAKGWLDNKPVCRECGEGKPCARSLAVKKAHAVPDPTELAAVAPTRYQRRCSECKAALSDLIIGELCSRCRKRAKEIGDRQAAAAERAAALALGKAG